MPYDVAAAERIRQAVTAAADVTEKKMFGGVGWLLAGNMCVGVWKEFLILRVGPEAHAEALAQPHAREFDITGRAMRGWTMVAPPGYQADADLAAWIDRAVTFVRTLPGK